MHGCSDCRYCKCYPGDYWTPDDYECTSNVWDRIDVDEEVVEKVWCDCEEWNDNEEPLCPGWEEVSTPEDDYWDRYAWEENHYDKDKAE